MDGCGGRARGGASLSTTGGDGHPNRFAHIHSFVVHTRAGDVTVLVNVQSEDPLERGFTDTVRAVLTYAPVKSDKLRIPALEFHGDEERGLFDEVEHRFALARAVQPQSS